MRALCCLVVALVGCGAPAPLYRPVSVDPSLGCAPDEALAEWQLATGGRYPQRDISFTVADPGDGLAGKTSVAGRVEDGHYIVTIRPGLDSELLHRVLLHELGHVAALMPDPEHPKPSHWHGAAPSVMRDNIDECSDAIGAPELAAFDRQYGR